MNPCELNALIASIANYLYSKLSKEEFFCLNVLLSELSKTMFSMEILGNVCCLEKKEKDVVKAPPCKK